MSSRIHVSIILTVFFMCALLSGALYAQYPHAGENGRYSFRLESNGTPLPTWQYKGQTYVAGPQGQDYAIRVFNQSNRRIEAVVTVDGRDVITGKKGNYQKNRGYVIQPYESVLIDGFRTSLNTVAGFYFTRIENAYSSRMGTPWNVGVIGVAIYEETPSVRRPVPVPYTRNEKSSADDHRSKRKHRRPSSAAAPEVTMENGTSTESRPRSRQEIGTGYGKQQRSAASHTSFTRHSRLPATTMAIYYDTYQQLVDKGIIPHYPTAPPTRPDPFPENHHSGFAPPPPPVPCPCR